MQASDHGCAERFLRGVDGCEDDELRSLCASPLNVLGLDQLIHTRARSEAGGPRVRSDLEFDCALSTVP